MLGSQIIGNPDLEPEQATSVEVGFAYENERMWIDLALFRNDITNRIQAVGDTRNALVRIYQNRAESELVGARAAEQLRAGPVRATIRA